MPFPNEATVIHHDGHDYWRTWFFEECVKTNLFGITEKHLPLLKAQKSLGGYSVGTSFFLEDAPYFKASGSHHLICGPYAIVGCNVPEDAVPVYQIDGQVIVYKANHPQNGPWFSKSRLTRVIKGKKISFPQLAHEFNYYPYRFQFQKTLKYTERLIEHHENDCWLCRRNRRR